MSSKIRENNELSSFFSTYPYDEGNRTYTWSAEQIQTAKKFLLEQHVFLDIEQRQEVLGDTPSLFNAHYIFAAPSHDDNQKPQLVAINHTLIEEVLKTYKDGDTPTPLLDYLVQGRESYDRTNAGLAKGTIEREINESDATYLAKLKKISTAPSTAVQDIPAQDTDTQDAPSAANTDLNISSKDFGIYIQPDTQSVHELKATFGKPDQIETHAFCEALIDNGGVIPKIIAIARPAGEQEFAKFEVIVPDTEISASLSVKGIQQVGFTAEHSITEPRKSILEAAHKSLETENIRIRHNAVASPDSQILNADIFDRDSDLPLTSREQVPGFLAWVKNNPIARANIQDTQADNGIISLSVGVRGASMDHRYSTTISMSPEFIQEAQKMARELYSADLPQIESLAYTNSIPNSLDNLGHSIARIRGTKPRPQTVLEGQDPN